MLMTGNKGRLTEGFREIIELRWTDFVERENAVDATNFDAVITGLIRACAKGNLRAIQTALDRLDGKVATEIQIEYPKFYTLYPRATTTVDDPGIIDLADEYSKHTLKSGLDESIMAATADVEELEAQNDEQPTGSLRAVLERMLNSPKDQVDEIITAAASIDKGEVYGNPRVKSVVVAGLMKMVHQGKIAAVFEVFDQIDGKVADTIKLLGGDVYMTNYSMIAPAGAQKNDDGVYYTVASNTTDQWAAKLEALNKRGR